MDNEIYITSAAGSQIENMSPAQQQRVKTAIDSLSSDGWANSQIVIPDTNAGGGLRAKLFDNLKVLFRYAPQEHAIIVADIAFIYEHQLGMTA